MKIELIAGRHISGVCQEAVDLAQKHNEPVEFDFNGTTVIAQPGETAETLEARWQADFNAAAEAYRNSVEYKQRKAREEEEYRQRCAASMREKATTEAEMREAKVPYPHTEAQLAEYVGSLVGRSHDYGTCVYAMSMAAVAAFNYVGHKLGVSGFQASCADMDILRRTRSLDGPFMLIKGEDALYPQYDLQGRLAEAMEEWKPWLAERAEKKLAEGSHAHPDVVAHWKKLAGGRVKEQGE